MSVYCANEEECKALAVMFALNQRPKLEGAYVVRNAGEFYEEVIRQLKDMEIENADMVIRELARKGHLTSGLGSFEGLENLPKQYVDDLKGLMVEGAECHDLGCLGLSIYSPHGLGLAELLTDKGGTYYGFNSLVYPVETPGAPYGYRYMDKKGAGASEVEPTPVEIPRGASTDRIKELFRQASGR